MKDDGLTLANGLSQRHLAQACAAWMRDKVEVRSVTKTGFLHGKMAHIRRGEVSAAILGSSNFTTRGLGLAATNNNVELNLVVRDDRDRDDLKQWFEELWNDTTRVEDVKPQVLDYLLQVYADQSPEFIYYKTLYHLFARFLEAGTGLDEALRKTTLLETGVWKSLFAFQKDGAKGAINKLRELGGCILADSVGLGKTYEALAVIKYFELKNERVLVLCPKKLADNWLLYRMNSALNPFLADRFRYDVLHHTDLSRESGSSNGIDLKALNWGNYDLVVIDESHNFRNNSVGPRDEDGEPIRRTRYERLMEDIIGTGIKSKILLLSATPVNNQLSDLRNQISFIAGGDVARWPEPDRAFETSLGIASLKATTQQAQARFTTWAKSPPHQREKKDLINVLGGDFLKLLDALTIARSRRHVARYYAGEMTRLGGFPERQAPISLHPEIDNPLTVITGYVELLRHRLDSVGSLYGADLQAVRDDVKLLAKQVTTCVAITRRYLRFVNRRSAQAPEVSVNQVIDDVHTLMRNHPNLRGGKLAAKHLERDACARIGGTELIQILLNLTVNAFQASDRPQTVWIAAERYDVPLPLGEFRDGEHERFINLEGFANEAPLVALSVIDQGPGIPRDVLARIFEPYFTTKPQGGGTGLGLAIVTRLIRHHQGLIHVKSTLGEGARFTIYLPAREPAPAR